MSLTLRDRLVDWRWWLGLKPQKLQKTLASGPAPNITVTIIIPAWNEENSIAHTIESALDQTYPATEIIVVDDFSDDNTNLIASVYAAKYPQVRVVRTEANQGTKARSQNYVLDQVKTDVFVTIDGDTALDPAAIEYTLPYFNDPRTAVICGFVVPQKIHTFWERGRFMEYVYGLTIMKSAQNHWGTPVVASGCFSVFRTHLAQHEFGGFESRTMAEDMDMTWTAHAKGYGVYYEPKAIAYPVDPSTFHVLFKQLERWYCAFFQNIMVRGNLFRHSKRLAVVVYSYAVWTILGAALVPVFAWAATQNLMATLVVMLLSTVVFTGTPVLWWSAKHGKFWTALSCFPAFIVISYLNVAMYAYAFTREVVVRNSLNKWTKGH